MLGYLLLILNFASIFEITNSLTSIFLHSSEFCPCHHLEIPVLTACGLIWTIILSLSAGNVKSSVGGEEEDAMVVEEKMVQDAGVSNGAGVAAVQVPTLFFGSNNDSAKGNAAGTLASSTKTSQNTEFGNRRK